ncbi:hypothetical protein EV361DRAFT_899473 [Lentinula raphanica]|nr:hypothetical protein EV361DRAFT_899473 [Lentinula raphanica]
MASLPPELLYEIFKLAGHEAQKSGKGLLNLTLVSHDTNNLIRSIALRFLILSISPRYAMPLKALHTVPPLCLQENVQSLWIIYALPDSDAQFALECCTNIKSLAYWSREPVASRLHIRSLIQALPHLTRLSAGVDFFIALCKESHLNRFSLSLRELAIFLIPADDDKVEIPDFSSFPNLTHFVIGTTTSVTLASSSARSVMLAIPQTRVSFVSQVLGRVLVSSTGKEDDPLGDFLILSEQHCLLYILGDPLALPGMWHDSIEETHTRTTSSSCPTVLQLANTQSIGTLYVDARFD